MISGTTWDESIGTYEVGGVVFYPVTGECYECVRPPAMGTLPTDGDYWKKIDFPVWLLGPVAALAELLLPDQGGLVLGLGATLLARQDLLGAEELNGLAVDGVVDARCHACHFCRSGCYSDFSSHHCSFNFRGIDSP
jgi:hypothetical protein